jgi:hypothetical protein
LTGKQCYWQKISSPLVDSLRLNSTAKGVTSWMLLLALQDTVYKPNIRNFENFVAILHWKSGVTETAILGPVSESLTLPVPKHN